MNHYILFVINEADNIVIAINIGEYIAKNIIKFTGSYNLSGETDFINVDTTKSYVFYHYLHVSFYDYLVYWLNYVVDSYIIKTDFIWGDFIKWQLIRLLE